MKYDPENGSWKLGEYSYGVDKKAPRKKVGYKTKVITIIVFISILMFIFYPLDLQRTAGIKNLTADDIASISLSQGIRIPKGIDIETKEFSMDDIADKIEGLRPLPLSENTELHFISMENITDKNFIEEVLVTLSNHNMRKRRFNRGVDYFRVDYSMPSSTRILINLKDADKTQVDISISHDPQYVSIYKFSSINGRSNGARYKIYGGGIDTQILFEIIRNFK